MTGALGRKVPTDWKHVDKFRFRVERAVENVERKLPLYTSWRVFYDQGAEGACVGFSSSQMMSVLNRHKYDARWLWNEAKKIDEWPDTNPGDDEGTSVRAAMDVLRAQGHARPTKTPEVKHGILENRWATSVDELRTSIANGIPVTMGTYWYNSFDEPVERDGEWWIDTADWDRRERGGHAYIFNYASDKRQAFRSPNTWGPDYPQVWFPYDMVEELIDREGEATLVTDRPKQSVVSQTTGSFLARLESCFA